MMWLNFLFCLVAFVTSAPDSPKLRFPADFGFGISSSNHQIEGAWNSDGKGISNWDEFCHNNPDKISDGSNGDIACDSYNLYKLDVQNIKNLGVKRYRFSISWSRILPEGDAKKVNQLGIAYYNNLINELLKNDIEPVVTIFHWDMPRPLVELGEWLNPEMADYYYDYAKVLFDNFADRVKYWITFNEPYHFCSPMGASKVISEYECARTVLTSHARVYRLYHKHYENYGGALGMSLNSLWCDPKTPNDIEAQERCLDYHIGWFAHPIFSVEGNYPPKMIERVANVSKAQKLRESRLPSLTSEEIQLIKGTADFFGLNYYTGRLASDDRDAMDLIKLDNKKPIFDQDMGLNLEMDPALEINKEVFWIVKQPQGLYDILMYIKDKYKNPPVIITENGWADSKMQDDGRINFLQEHLEKISDAIQDGANVKGYHVWSLMDSFEWRYGYTKKFGLYYVNFTDPARTRTPRASAKWLKTIMDDHRQRHGIDY